LAASVISLSENVTVESNWAANWAPAFDAPAGVEPAAALADGRVLDAVALAEVAVTRVPLADAAAAALAEKLMIPPLAIVNKITPAPHLGRRGIRIEQSNTPSLVNSLGFLP
jgi:hypothetical protein